MVDKIAPVLIDVSLLWKPKTADIDYGCFSHGTVHKVH